MARIESSKRPTIGRPDDRSREIEAILRGRIAARVWPPGSRIPTRVKLCEEFTAGPITIQRILAAMEEEGFIVSSRNTGTHVTDTPPPCVNVAVIVPAKVRNNRFYQALVEVATRPRADGLRPIVYQQVDGHLDSPDSLSLLDDLRRRRLMGLLFATPPHDIADTTIVTQTEIPACIIMTPTEKYRHCSTVGIDAASFRQRALGFLRSRGRSRIAVIGYGDPSARWEPALAAAGLTTHSWWQQAIDAAQRIPCRRLAQLLFNPHQTEKPDGLIILDDNAVADLTAGIHDMGIAVPANLDIVCQCNFPIVPDAALPITPIGYAMADLFDRALASLAQQRAGTMPEHVNIPAQHVAEVT